MYNQRVANTRDVEFSSEMHNQRVAYTADAESPWETYNQRGAYTSQVESLWIGTPEESGVEDFVVNGGKWGTSGTLGTPGGTVTWSLPTAGITNQTGANFFTGSTVSFSSIVTFDFQTVIQSVFDAWSAVTSISFTQVADGGGNTGVGTTADIRIVAGFIDGNVGANVLARAFLPNAGSGSSSQGAANGDVVMDSGNTWTQNLFFLTMLHEVGHSLGLSHSSVTAIMSPTINTSLTGLQPDDIAGIQTIYGLPPASGPDLTASNVAVSDTTPNAGDSITVTYDISNIGSGSAINTTAGIYLSTNSFISTGDTLLATQLSSISNNPGSVDPETQIITLSGTLAPGTYYIGVIADYNNQETEANEGNNNSTGIAITIPPLDDFAANTGTAGAVVPGGSATGDIETSGDHDWFRITLTAGTEYEFQAQGGPTAMGTLSDPTLTLRNSAGTLIEFDDDDGTGFNSLITFTATTSGTFYLDAGAFLTNTGTYVVSATVLGGGVPHDFNGDGRSDFLWQNDNGAAAIWQMNGTTITGGGFAGNNPGPTWNIQDTGDFNGDGNSDILWQNDNGQAAIWQMSGTTVIGGGLAGNIPGPTWQIEGTGDFNNDGNSDIVFQNDNGQAAIWLMNGNTVIGGGLAGNNPGPTWQIGGTGDFNNDGNSDIVWQNDNGQAAIWFMNGNTVIGGGLAGGNPGPTWHIRETGDYNGDGKFDFVWQNDSGQAAIWFMDGTTVIGGGLAGSNPGPDWMLFT